MRVLRTLVGLVLVLVGTAALVIATISWNAMSQRDSEERFTATLEPVSTEGYAIVVPDLLGQTDRFGIGGLLGDGPLRISAVESSAPIVLVVAPMDEVDRYLTGANRSEITAVGYAEGPQPVSLAAIAGNAVPGPIQDDTFSTRPRTTRVEWTPGDEPTSLVVLRADGGPGLAVTLAVSRDAQWLTTVTWAMLVGGVVGALGGLGVVFWPEARREMVLVLEAHRMVDFADRMAEKVSGAKPGRTRPEVVRRMPLHDLTGEVVAIAAEAHQPAESRQPPPAGLPPDGGRQATNRRRDDAGVAPHRRNRRDGWRDRDEGRSRRDSVTGNQRRSMWPNRRSVGVFDVDSDVDEWMDDVAAGVDEPDFDASAYDDRSAGYGIDDPTGESPYVQTAT
jgi:hypothetical protein